MWKCNPEQTQFIFYWSDLSKNRIWSVVFDHYSILNYSFVLIFSIKLHIFYIASLAFLYKMFNIFSNAIKRNDVQ